MSFTPYVRRRVRSQLSYAAYHIIIELLHRQFAHHSNIGVIFMQLTREKRILIVMADN